MGRRKLRVKRYDDFEQREEITRVPNDLRQAAKVKALKDLEIIANRQGAVSDYLVQANFLDYKPDGSLAIKKSVVAEQAEALVTGIENTRFYGLREVQRLQQEQAESYGVSVTEIRKLNARDAQVKATGILAAAQAGGVKLSSYRKGVLNKLAKGEYTEAIFGKKDSSGQYRYERGTFENQLGIGRGSGSAYADSGFNARAREQAQILREYRQGGTSTGRKDNDPKYREYIQRLGSRFQTQDVVF